ncbi:hypothetical protein F4809DRAFT_231296 [Biscogniauxia mediterranea]|nr:hypothetical protein F4809DRAFT_231296 [Biscogniauxia mediterranea]
MAIIGLSLVLASVVYFAIRRPPLIQTFLALWRGYPRIDQPPNTRSPPSTGTTATQDQWRADSPPGQHVSEASAPTSASSAVADRAAMPPPPPPPPPPVTRTPNETANTSTTTTTTTTTPPEPPTISTSSPQTTPKASATQLNGSIPSFSLSASPPPSSAAVARAANPTASPSTPTSSMAPPPRPPTLTTPNSSSSSSSHLSAPRPPSGPLPNRSATYDRQPGTSTLAPPPTHSSKPAKPSRQVSLRPGHSPLDWARLAGAPASDLRGLAPGTPYLRVTPGMLRRQTGRRGRDAWTALGGRVYNLTPYLPFHPGGEPELLRAAARDGSRLFAEVHPWVNYETMLAACLVGLLVDEAEAESTGEMDAMD